MDTYASEIEYKDHVYVPYRVETLHENAYLVYFLERGKNLHFMKKKEHPFNLSHTFKGAINWKERSYLFYEMTQSEDEFLSSEKDDVLKVTPYEILYSRKVLDIPIHEECIDFFKAFPKLCFVENQEVPVVAYLGLGVSEIKEQILLQTINEKVGIFGKGYYFTDEEGAFYDAYYKQTDDQLVRLDNPLSDKMIKNDTVHIKDDAFYHGTHYLGKVNSCKKNIKYSIYYYDEEVIYLKSVKPHECHQVQLRKESGYVMRYILFLKKHSMNKREGDSYASHSTYMVKNADDFICLSYHYVKKK